MANRIKELRKKRGLTIAALADMVGVTSRQITYLENEERDLTLKMMEKIAKALGVSPAEIITKIDALQTDSDASIMNLCSAIAELARSYPKKPTAVLAAIGLTVLRDIRMGRLLVPRRKSGGGDSTDADPFIRAAEKLIGQQLSELN